MYTNTFDVCDQILGRVLTQFRMRSGAPTTALIKQDDAAVFGIEKTAVEGLAGRAGSTVQKDDGDPFGIAAFLNPQGMPIADPERELTVRFDLWIELQ